MIERPILHVQDDKVLDARVTGCSGRRPGTGRCRHSNPREDQQQPLEAAGVSEHRRPSGVQIVAPLLL